jgi:polysaccharide pyruvyl transferase WcaK-like protein
MPQGRERKAPMTLRNLQPEDKDQYDRRFQMFLSKMIDVAKCQPKEKYLYSVMESIPFKDLEVALDMALKERAKWKSNDNRK